MSDTAQGGRPAGPARFRIVPRDRAAILWAIACCWVAVGGNYLLLELKLRAYYIVPFDLFATPLIVTAVFWTAGRLFRRR